MQEAWTELERFGPLLELRLGQVLAPLVRGGLKDLGYVTPAMFCREELGISATAGWDSVHLAEGLLRRPILRQAFLDGKLPRTHALELLRLDQGGDAGWAARAAHLTVHELRQAVRPLRSSTPGEEKEKARVRTWELEAEPYATWLAALELARRREGRDLGPVHLIEQILAEFAAARPLKATAEGSLSVDPGLKTCGGQAGVPETGWLRSVEGGAGLPLPAGLSPNPEVGHDAAEEPCAPALPPFQRDPRWPTSAPPAAPESSGGRSGLCGAAPDAGSAQTGPEDAGAGAAPATPDSGQAPPSPELPSLLREELPRSPRKLTRLACRLLASRENLELQRGRILRRVQEGRLYREAGFRSFRGWLEIRGIAASTAFQAAARDQRLDRHELLRRALCEGRLSPAKVDLLLRLPRRADLENWAAYAEEHTCRRLEEAVEAALVLAARFPSTWNLRRGAAPGDEEPLEEFRQQAGLKGFEATLDELAQAFDQVGSGPTTPEGVRTSVAPPATPAPNDSLGRTAAEDEPVSGSRPLAAACESGDALQAKARPPGNPSPSAPETPEIVEPPPTIRLRLVLPESVDRLLQAAEARLRQDADEALTSEECLYILCLVFLRQAGLEDSGQSRVRRQALERAGYRCEVPGCACRTNLHVHHIHRRSQGGSDELENLAVACAAHHLRHLHGGTMRVEGADPATRIWEIGLQGGEPCLIPPPGVRTEGVEAGLDARKACIEERSVVGNYVSTAEVRLTTQTGPRRLPNATVGGGFRPWRVWCDERLVDGEALVWEEEEGEWPSGDDRVCEATPEYRCGPATLASETCAA